ncbi:MAG: 3-isopropylmalate dehydratase [Pseudomonadota bacterium]
MTTTGGRVWLFGDNIDTDVLAPGHLMKLPARELASHCLKAVNPVFAKDVKPGDFIVAGRNFGLGSSREQAAESLKLLGLRAVIATSFARIFFRNAINLGLPAVALDVSDAFNEGDAAQIDLHKGVLKNQTSGTEHLFPAMAPALLEILDAGGLMPLLAKQLAAKKLRDAPRHPD